MSQFTNLRPYGIGIGILLFAVFGIAGINSLIKNLAGKAIQTPTLSSEGVVSSTSTFPPSPPTDTATNPPFTPTSGFVIGSTMTGKDSMTLLYVPAGEFTMGSEIGDDDEKPVHAVYLDAFWIDQTEVTNGMYAMCVEAGECTKHFIESSFSRPNYYGNPEFDDFPVIYVSWDYASAYCSWADRRLPTEAEWEKAARGENAFIYPWGENEPNNTFLNYVSSDTPGEDNDTTKVGKYPKGASPYGALDMAGNVWEWVSDWYDPNYYNSSPSSNPQGPESGQQRITRGGSWQENISFTIRSAYRVETDPLGMDNALGFRCAMSASK